MLVTREQIAGEVYAAINEHVVRVGRLVDDAMGRMTRASFEEWVRDELPFDVYAARRFRAVYLAWRELPEEMLVEMPEPWQALYVRR